MLKIFLVQETNEKSFKLLQDYIANANADARDRGGYGGPYDFEFYSSSTGDEKIQLTLPAPVRDEGECFVRFILFYDDTLFVWYIEPVVTTGNQTRVEQAL